MSPRRPRGGTRYAPRERAVLMLAPPLAATILQGIARTCTFDVRDAHYLHDTLQRHGNALVAFWHETIAMAAWHFRHAGYSTLTSQSFDGELAARILGWYGFRVARGSSSRGGFDALVQLIQALETSACVGFTLDGPRGPRRVAKPGIAIIAARTGVPIVPVAFEAAPAWRLKSWDRLVIPRPFAPVACRFGAPVAVEKTRDPEAVEGIRRAVEDRLNALHHEASECLGGRESGGEGGSPPSSRP